LLMVLSGSPSGKRSPLVCCVVFGVVG
jgi:hypothetical protein